MIEVTRSSAFAFEVEIIDDAEPSRHLVAAAPEMLERLAPGHAPEAVIEAAFRFLLDREPKQSIMPEFDFTVIASYFPEFEAELPVISIGETPLLRPAPLCPTERHEHTGRCSRRRPRGATKLGRSDTRWSPSSGIDVRMRWTGAPDQAVLVTDQRGDEMPMIRLTIETMTLIRGQSLPDFRFVNYATEIDDGSWDVPVNDEVAFQIAQQRPTAESDDHVVSRLVQAEVSEPT